MDSIGNSQALAPSLRPGPSTQTPQARQLSEGFDIPDAPGTSAMSNSSVGSRVSNVAASSVVSAAEGGAGSPNTPDLFLNESSPYSLNGFLLAPRRGGNNNKKTDTTLNSWYLYHLERDSKQTVIHKNILMIFRIMVFYGRFSDNPDFLLMVIQDLIWTEQTAESYVLETVITRYTTARELYLEKHPLVPIPESASIVEQMLMKLVDSFRLVLGRRRLGIPQNDSSSIDATRAAWKREYTESPSSLLYKMPSMAASDEMDWEQGDRKPASSRPIDVSGASQSSSQHNDRLRPHAPPSSQRGAHGQNYLASPAWKSNTGEGDRGVSAAPATKPAATAKTNTSQTRIANTPTVAPSSDPGLGEKRKAEDPLDRNGDGKKAKVEATKGNGKAGQQSHPSKQAMRPQLTPHQSIRNTADHDKIQPNETRQGMPATRALHNAVDPSSGITATPGPRLLRLAPLDSLIKESEAEKKKKSQPKVKVKTSKTDTAAKNSPQIPNPAADRSEPSQAPTAPRLLNVLPLRSQSPACHSKPGAEKSASVAQATLAAPTETAAMAGSAQATMRRFPAVDPQTLKPQAAHPLSSQSPPIRPVANLPGGQPNGNPHVVSAVVRGEKHSMHHQPSEPIQVPDDNKFANIIKDTIQQMRDLTRTYKLSDLTMPRVTSQIKVLQGVAGLAAELDEELQRLG